MSKISFKSRTGKDLFDYMTRGLIDSKLATQWAIQEFVLIDGSPLDIKMIAGLSDEAFILISSRVFPLKDERVFEDNQGIHFGNILIKNKRIHRDFITEMQTDIIRFKNDQIGLLRQCLVTFFETTIEEIEEMPFNLVVRLINKVNTFLDELSNTGDEFEITNIWSNSTGVASGGELGNLLPSSDSILKEAK